MGSSEAATPAHLAARPFSSLPGPAPPPPTTAADLFSLTASLLASLADAGADVLASAGVCEAEARKGGQTFFEGVSARVGGGGGGGGGSAAAAGPATPPPASNRPPPTGRVPTITPAVPLAQAVAALDAEVAAARAAVARLREGQE